MRLARHQQHPQSITHAVDNDDRPIVVEGQLLRPGLDLDFDDVWPAMVDYHRQRDISPDRYGDLMRGAAVLAPRDLRLARTPLGLLGRALGQILDAYCELQLLADEAEARRLVDDHSSVTLVRPAGEEGMKRGSERLCRRSWLAAGRVVHLPISDHHNPGKALARHIRHRAIES